MGEKYSLRGMDGSGKTTIVKGAQSLDNWNPLDTETMFSILETITLNRMFDRSKQSSGFTGGAGDRVALDASPQMAIFIKESTHLRKFYKKVDYTVAENDDTSLTDLQGFIRRASNFLIKDAKVLARIGQVSKSSPQANFLYAANANRLFYITVFKGAALKVQVRSYMVEGGLPAGAFVVSTRAWAIENKGQASKVTVWNLMQEFKALN